jgi:hypothetical protein
MRFRKDLGDLTDLKKSIKENGLIHPVVIDSKGNLIAGERRRAACRELGFEPEYRVVDFDNPQQAEVDENTCRKNFTWREIYEIAKYFNEKYSKQGQRSDLTGNDSNGNGDFVQNPNKVKKPIQKVAKATGKSADTISKLNQIYGSSYEEVKKDLDSNHISVDEAYSRVKRRETEETRRKKNEAIRAEFYKMFAGTERVRDPEEETKRRVEETKRRVEETERHEKKLKEKLAMGRKLIDSGYKEMSKRLHPDKGGTNEAMHELQDVKKLLISSFEYQFPKLRG